MFATVDTALSTLSTTTALLMNSSYSNLQNAFLVKKVVYNLYLTGVTAGEGPFAIFLGNGNATATEITNGFIAGNTVGPKDVTQSLLQDQAWLVWRNSTMHGTPIHDSTIVTFQGEKSLGKGIPAQSDPSGIGAGVSLSIINLFDGSLTTGAILKGSYHLWGVWLED